MSWYQVSLSCWYSCPCCTNTRLCNMFVRCKCLFIHAPNLYCKKTVLVETLKSLFSLYNKIQKTNHCMCLSWWLGAGLWQAWEHGVQASEEGFLQAQGLHRTVYHKGKIGSGGPMVRNSDHTVKNKAGRRPKCAHVPLRLLKYHACVHSQVLSEL